MINNAQDLHTKLANRIAQKYQKEGYQVFHEPKQPGLPFDLGSYQPDLIVMKSDHEGYIIEIKNKASTISIDRYREIAELVSKHKGWQFLLVTGDDILNKYSDQKQEEPLLTWDQIMALKKEGENLLSLGMSHGAFLIFWSMFEAMMRKHAEQVSIPIERFPTNSLIKHLYSQGEISIEQFDQAKNLLNLRNKLVHGYQISNSDREVRDLDQLTSELLDQWRQE